MKTIFIACVLYCVVPTSASAALIFTEIMYNPAGSDSGREWVEVYNDGNDSIDITGWKFGDAGSPNHTIYDPLDPGHLGKGSMIIPPKGYMVIAADAEAFLSLFPDIPSSVVDTAMSLPNGGTTISLRDASNAPAQVVEAYIPLTDAENTGSSLQRRGDGVWVAAPATPGIGFASTEKNESTTPVVQGTFAQAKMGASSEKLPMLADITIPEQVITGVSFTTTIAVYGHAGEYRHGGLFRVVFGDGTATSIERPDAISHTYEHAGTYVVVFEYYFNRYVDTPAVRGEYVVSVKDPLVTLRPVTKTAVEIRNTGEEDLDISLWRLGNTLLPKGTMLLAGASVVVVSDDPILRLPSGRIVAQYQEEEKKVLAAQTYISQQKKEVEPVPLVAQVVASNSEIQEEPTESRGSPLWVFILTLVLVVGASWYFLRKENTTEEEKGDDTVTILGPEE